MVFGMDFVVVNGQPGPAGLTCLASLYGRDVQLLGALGAWPDSYHAGRCAEIATSLREKNGNRVPDVFLCQGKVDPALRERMPERMRLTHPMTPERQRCLRAVCC